MKHTSSELILVCPDMKVDNVGLVNYLKDVTREKFTDIDAKRFSTKMNIGS